MYRLLLALLILVVIGCGCRNKQKKDSVPVDALSTPEVVERPDAGGFEMEVPPPPTESEWTRMHAEGYFEYRDAMIHVYRELGAQMVDPDSPLMKVEGKDAEEARSCVNMLGAMLDRMAGESPLLYHMDEAALTRIRELIDCWDETADIMASVRLNTPEVPESSVTDLRTMAKALDKMRVAIQNELARVR